MNTDNAILALAVVVVLVSAVGAFLTYSTFSSTGVFFGPQTGTANLSVESAAVINFTTDNINWGSGRVDDGFPSATLDTSRPVGTAVVNGNWTRVTQGFVVENIGNVNVSLDLKTGKTAAEFIGGSGPAYQYNVSNVEAASCVTTAGAAMANNGIFRNANTVGVGDRICDRFPSQAASDTIRIDLRLVVPSDSRTGALGDTISATITAI